MALFGGREVPINIIFNNDQFQEIMTEVRVLVGEVDAAVTRLEGAKKELILARKELDKSLAKLQMEKRRPVRNS